MADDDVIVTGGDEEKKCPQCGGVRLAWVTTEGDIDTFECRQCRILFRYRGQWEPERR